MHKKVFQRLHTKCGAYIYISSEVVCCYSSLYFVLVYVHGDLDGK